MGPCLRRSKFAFASLALAVVGGFAISGSLAACLQSNAETCNDGTLCPGTSVCAPLGGCAQPGQAAACTGVADDGACSYSGVTGVCHNQLCAPPRCGDGFKEPSEQCDDGNSIAGDGCSVNCTIETCGNGIIDPHEGCDDGNTNDHDGCQHNCQIERCGDGITDTLAGEVCDDGNNNDGDGCSADCRSDESCGNSIVDWAVGEDCDDGNDLAGDGCSDHCRVTPLATWTLRRLASTPSKRHDHAVATDVGRARVVMFGGADAHGHIAETWEWDGRDWLQLKPETSPTPRAGLAMTYDSDLARVVMFGGINGTIGNYNDTWVWNGQSWKLDIGAGNPGARHEHAMAYDPLRKQIVMFGGINGGDLGDTWVYAWDDALMKFKWTGVAPPSATTPAPIPRHGHKMAFDPRIGKVILVGGTNDDPTAGGTASTSSDVLSDTWSWDGAVWTQLGSLPTPTTSAALAFDTAQQQMVLFGGDDAVGTVLDTALLFDGANWAVDTTHVVAPSARDSSTLTMSPDGTALMLFGGDDQGFALNDTWLRDGIAWSLAQAGQSTTSDAANQVPQLAYDPTRGRSVRLIHVFSGGLPWSTWEWDGIDWTQMPGLSSQSTAGALVYDPSQRNVLFVGSSNSHASAAMETSEWNGTSWTLQSPVHAPVARTGPAVASDPLINGVLLFGGNLLQGNTASNETWLWDGTDWQLLAPATSPPATPNATLAFDPVSQAMLMFIAQTSSNSGVVPSQTWTWDGTNWKQLTPPSGSPALTQSMMQTDTVDGFIVLIGNEATSASTYQWTGSDWQLLVTAPFQTSKQDGLAYDAINGAFVRTGHLDTVGAVVDDNETWTLSMNGVAKENCTQGVDVDGDGAIGCADSDCWPVCNPTCEPGTSCPNGAPNCGDGICSPIENYRACPADCAAPPPVCGDMLCDSGESVSCPSDC